MAKNLFPKGNQIAVKHGGHRTRIYRIWQRMRQRCYDKNYKPYPRYGGRGIGVCPDWYYHFTAFRDWALANGYEENLSLDRIDNDGHYTPENCRWATSYEQMQNTCSVVAITAFGDTQSIAAWERDPRCKATYSTICRRLKQGWSTEDAISKPGYKARSAQPSS